MVSIKSNRLGKNIDIIAINNLTNVRSSYGPLAYFSDIFISGKNVVFSVHKYQD